MKKGFTLIELLAVIIILGILTIMIVPKVNDTITKTEEDAYQRQITSLVNQAKKWGASNNDKLPEDGSIKILNFSTLSNEGYIKEKDVINPKTDEKLEGCIKISYDAEYSQYVYEYTDDNNICNE